MDHRVFMQICDRVYRVAGITLGEGKEALVSARVGKRLRALQLDCDKEYLKYLENDETGTEIVELLDVISTNVTSFFREAEHFDILSGIMVEWMKAGQKRFRLWSAASSTGEEPYSIAMTLAELKGAASCDMKLLATDISTRVLRHCVEGVYTVDKVGSIPRQRLDTWFDRVEYDDGRMAFQVDERLRSMVTFRRLNLNQPPFPMQGPLDAVFCRNVMIYFDNEVRKRLIEEIYRLLKPGGYLFVGHSESLTGIHGAFKALRPSVYVK